MSMDFPFAETSAKELSQMISQKEKLTEILQKMRDKMTMWKALVEAVLSKF